MICQALSQLYSGRLLVKHDLAEYVFYEAAAYQTSTSTTH